MAFSDSIKWNGKSIRDLFAEITEVRGRGKPALKTTGVDVPGRHGRIAFKQTYKPRVIEIEGTIEGSSHASLMSNIENVKSLFAMEDETLPPGEESIVDGMKYGRLEFGDETDRHYRAVFDGILEFPELSHRWMSNDMKHFRARFRCDDPFSYSNTQSEVSMSAKANEFKKINTGTMRSKPVIELKGAVTNPMIVEGDKTAVVHFDYNDNLSDVTLSMVSGNFTNKFGYRSVKSLTARQSKAIQLTGSDNLYYDRGSIVNGVNYTNFNPYQGTLIFWVKPYFDGDDGKNHMIFFELGDSNDYVFVEKGSGNQLILEVAHNGAIANANIIVNSANFAAGTWYFIACRWDRNNSIDGTNTIGIKLGSAENKDNTALGTPAAVDTKISIGLRQDTVNALFDGLIYYEIHERALTDTEVLALYNSGAGVEPNVTPDTRLLSSGELDGSDLPVSVQHPWVDNKFAANDGSMEDDPFTEWTAVGSINISNESTVVKYDLQSVELEWNQALSDEYAHLDTDALVDNKDYFYRLWIYVSSLNASDKLYLDIVGSSTVHTRRLDSGSDDLGVTYTTGKWLYYEGVLKADGAVAHQFRLRKNGVNGNATIYVDQMECAPNLQQNGVMEGTYIESGEVPPDWTGLQPLQYVGSKDTSEFHSGSASWKADTFTGTARGIYQDLSFSAGKWYTVSGWFKITSGSVYRFGIDDLFGGLTVAGRKSFQPSDSDTPDSSNAADWTKFSCTFKAITSGTGRLVVLGQPNLSVNVDDVSIVELDTVSANASAKATTEIDSYSQEIFGQGLRIDGGDTLSWNIVGNKNEGSVILWLRPQFAADWADDTDDPLIIEIYYDSNNYLRIFYDWTNDKFVFRKRAAGVDYDSEAGSQTFSKDDRLCLIGTFGSNGVRVYVNGTLGSVTNANATTLAGNPVSIQMSDNAQTSFPDSVFDEIYLLSRELSAQEVLKYSNAFRAQKNDNAKFSMTKVLAAGDKLLINSEEETVEFGDSSAGTFVNAIASMDSGSHFPNLDPNQAVIYNKTAGGGIKLDFLKKWL